MRFLALAAAALAGCAAAGSAEVAHDVEPYSTGATLYVLEAYDSFLDDTSVPVYSPVGDGTAWMGVEAMRIALRAATRGSRARFVSVSRFDLFDGTTARVRTRERVHFMEKQADGRYALREFGERAGFELSVKGNLHEDGHYVDVDYRLRYQRPQRAKLEGTELEAGEPRMNEVWVNGACLTLPVGGAILIPYRLERPRFRLVILHVASVRPAELH